MKHPPNWCSCQTIPKSVLFRMNQRNCKSYVVITFYLFSAVQGVLYITNNVKINYICSLPPSPLLGEVLVIATASWHVWIQQQQFLNVNN